jgi:hypothetical protein
MAFTAEAMAFCKVYEFSIIKAEFITVFCIMAIEAPAHGFGVMHADLRMLLLQLPFFTVCFHGSMTIATRKHSFCKRRGRDRELLGSCLDRGSQKKS